MNTKKTYEVEVHLDCGLIVLQDVDAFVQEDKDEELKDAAIGAALKVSADYSQVVDYARVIVGDNITLYETEFEPECFDCYDEDYDESHFDAH